MDKRQYEKAFDRFYSVRRFDEALEVAGAMKYTGISGSRYLEMLIYFERGEYDKVRNALKGKRIDNVEEREFYLASLIELRLYDEFTGYYSEHESLSEACILYMEHLMKRQGHVIPIQHKAVMDYPTFFDRRYRFLIADMIADIFNLNEERLMLIDARMPGADIDELTRKIMDRFRQIRVNDAVDMLIKVFVDAKQPIPVDNVLYFPLMHFVPADKLDDVVRRYDDIRDIADMLELCRKIHIPEVERDAVLRYFNEISEALRDGNMYMINLMAEIYADIGHLRGIAQGFGMENAADRVYAALQKDAPYMLTEIEDHVMDKRVEETLSPKGLFSYRASGWKLFNALRNEMDKDEGHILCLSFLRLLQHEINEKLLFPICDTLDIRNRYERFKDKLNDVERGEFIDEWEYKVSCLEKISPARCIGMRFAGLITFFDSLKFKRYKRESAHREFAGELRAVLYEILTDEGKTAIADGTIVRMIEPERLEGFREETSRSKYDGLELSIACRKYVEQELIDLASYVK